MQESLPSYDSLNVLDIQRFLVITRQFLIIKESDSFNTFLDSGQQFLKIHKIYEKRKTRKKSYFNTHVVHTL